MSFSFTKRQKERFSLIIKQAEHLRKTTPEQRFREFCRMQHRIANEYWKALKERYPDKSYDDLIVLTKEMANAGR